VSPSLPPGPYKTLSVDGQTVPEYIIPFDKEGTCTGPETREEMLTSLASGRFTDIFLFSHGWNNDWSVASKRYDDFIEGFGKQRANRNSDYGRPYAPLLAGVFWPSTALVLPSEEGPDFAAAGLDQQAVDASVDAGELAAAIPAASRARFDELMKKPSFAPGDEEALAALLAPVWNDLQRAGTNEADVRVEPMTAAELVALWRSDRAVARVQEADEYGGLAAGSPVATAMPGAALSIGDIVNAPRDLIRAFTVLQMKDRAVRVGGSGVAALLRDVLQRSQARVHLIGHSYGCIIMLSALSAIPSSAVTRKVDSVLLLQAAVSRFCFATKVPGKPYPGGYRVAFDRVTQPILATFTRRDLPLTKLFHWAVRRDSDLGQPEIAGVRPAPSKYAALGGFGPDGCLDSEYLVEPIHAVGQPYVLDTPQLRIVALQADEEIKGHGAVSVPETWWALFNQVRGA